MRVLHVGRLAVEKDVGTLVRAFQLAHTVLGAEAEFIVGNPPFIGGKDIRANLGNVYAETLWAVHEEVPDSADFVMYWWDRAASLLTAKGTVLRRFGFVTSRRNSA